jgi:hypothetical protein
MPAFMLVHGSPEECAEQITDLEDAGRDSDFGSAAPEMVKSREGAHRCSGDGAIRLNVSIFFETRHPQRSP